MKTMQRVSFSQSDWERYAKCYDSLNALSPYSEMLDEVEESLRLKHGEYFLDAACGTGNLGKRVARSSLYGPVTFACDYSEMMLSHAQAKCGKMVHFLHLDLNRTLPFADGTMNAIACINTLYAVQDPESLLKEFFRVMKKNGRMVVVTPKRNYQNGIILKAHCKSDKDNSYWENVHVSQETEESRIREACGETELSRDMIHIGRFNRSIQKNQLFHFFSQDELRKLMISTGFSISTERMTYAKQCHLFLANT